MTQPFCFCKNAGEKLPSAQPFCFCKKPGEIAFGFSLFAFAKTLGKMPLASAFFKKSLGKKRLMLSAFVNRFRGMTNSWFYMVNYG